MRSPSLHATWLLFGSLLVGCGGGGGRQEEQIHTPARPLVLNTLSFTVEAGVNSNSPVRVELVRVHDMSLISELIRIETSAWFGSAGDAFRQAHPEAIYDPWELPPGLQFGPFAMAVDGQVAGVLFCEAGSGTPPIRMEINGDVGVTISDGGCTLGGGEPVRETSNWNPLNWW